MKTATIAVFLVLLVTVPAQSQTGRPSSLKELASYGGADRERLLVEGAKREGKLVWYTTLAARQNKQLTKAFEDKYPGVKVETYRTNSTALTQRVLTEAKAGRHLVDAIETTLPGLFTFREAELLSPYTSPHLGEFPEDSKEDAPNKLVHWTIDRESFVGFAYNKKSLSAADAPKTFDDLLKPGLKNKMAMAGGSTGARMIGAMLKAKGKTYVMSLKEQNMRLHMIAASALTQLVASGEVTASPSQFYSAAHVAIAKGAPLVWVPMELVVASGGGSAVYAHAQRPHAALLFVDFLLSSEGQKLYEDLYFGSPKKNYGFKRWYPEKGLTLDQYEKEQEKWNDLLMQITQK